MNKLAKVFLAGIVLALFVFSVGYVGSERSKARVSELVAQCKSENTHITASPDKPWESVPIDCDPTELRQLSINLPSVGVQAKIVDTQREGESWFQAAVYIAIGVVLLSGAPYAWYFLLRGIPSTWYFLLRRIRELREAIIGK